MSYQSFAEFYDVLTDNVGYKKLSDYICSLLSQNGINGGLLLDLACGTGTLSILLEKQGFSVIGVDASEEMLSVAQSKLYDGSRDIMFLCQNMLYLDLYGTVDCAVCTLDSLNHLADINEVKKAIEKVSLFMNPGGIFIFDVNTLYKHRNVLGNNAFIYDCGSVLCAWQNTLCNNNATVDIDLDFFTENDNGTYDRFCESFSETAYELAEIENAVKEAGFEIINIYNEMSEDKPESDCERAVFVVKKTALTKFADC